MDVSNVSAITKPAIIVRGRSRPLAQCLMALLPPFNFITLHYAYFLVTPLICSAIFWGAATSSRSVAYVDALFLCVSAMTGAGLNTVRSALLGYREPLLNFLFSQLDLSSLNSFQQSILFALLFLGHAILISSTVLFVRKRAFELKFKGISNERAQLDRADQSLSFNHLFDGADNPVGNEPGHQLSVLNSQGAKVPSTVAAAPVEASVVPENDDHIRWMDDDQITIGHMRPRSHHHSHRMFPMVGVGARPDLNNHPRDVPPSMSLPPEAEKGDVSRFKGMIQGTQKYFASKGLISRNSQFHGLTPEEREKLGGVEYRAVSFLSVIVLLYWLMFMLFGIVGMGSWLEANHPDVARENGLSPFWTGAFFAVSAFVNSGMSLLDANMTALQTR